jgi:hypothetical protein
MERSDGLSLEFSAEATKAAASTGDGPAEMAAGPGVSPDQFTAAFGESIQRTLDLSTWRAGEDLGLVYERITREVAEAVRQEERVREPFRRTVFPRIVQRADAPKGAGLYRAKRSTIERIHRGLLFRGAVEACDGTIQRHDTLPVTFFQVGVGLVSYRGDQGTWAQRLFRRDLRVAGEDPVDEAMRLIERRAERSGLNQPDARDGLGEMAQRAIMEYAERAILLHRSTAPWRMGHGSPAPYTLLTGSGSMDLMIESTRMLEDLIVRHQKFVFVASEPSQRLLLSIGQALEPLEYVIVDTLAEQIRPTVERAHYAYHYRYTADTTIDGVRLTPAEWIGRFRDEVAAKVVVGLYRASRVAPPQLFYAHQDHAHLAANIALADSVLQNHRGFPVLIDLADRICATTFGPDSLAGPLQAAYAEAGAPFRYLSERASRRL